MTELYPSDNQLNLLSGAADPQQEVLYIPIGQSPYHTSFYKMLYRLLDVCRRGGDLRVYKDGDLTFGVRAGAFMNGPAPVSFAGSAGVALANNAVNWIYLTAAGALTANQTGLPDPATTPHVPLASITTAAGAYAHADVADLRGRAMYRAIGAVPRADLQLQTLDLAIPLTSLRKGSEGNLSAGLGSAADGSDLGLLSTGFGQAASAPRVVSSSLSAGGTLTQKARVLIALPVEYQAGSAITCRVAARADACQVGATVALAAYELNGTGSYAGSPTNLCTTGAQNLSSSYSTLEFALTAPAGGPGSVLDVLLTVALNDTGGSGGAKQALLASLELALPVRG
jgi:hypothetical protein